eukprot:scaffold21655_cov66-Skeletonema_marinoi.AAC.2
MRVENPSLCRASCMHAYASLHIQFNGDVIKGESEVMQVSYCTSYDHLSKNWLQKLPKIPVEFP